MIVTISLVGPSASVRGLLRNFFLEPQAHLFVGSINAKQLIEVVSILEEHKCIGMIVVQSNKHPMGVRLKQLGQADRHVIEYDGLQLIKKTYLNQRDRWQSAPRVGGG